MACNDGIYKNITSNCTTQKSGGMETVAWAIYRPDIKTITVSPTNPVLITDLVLANGKKAIEIKGFRKNLNSGHTLVTAENKPDKYSHYFNLVQYEILAEDIQNADKLNDMVIIYERKHKTATGEGVFVIRGLRYGLIKSTDTKDENTDDAMRALVLSSEGGNEETQSEYIYFNTDYATSKADIIALLTPA